jgi:hypothetical protein
MARKADLIEFENDLIVRTDYTQALERFAELYRGMKEANQITCTENLNVKFNMNYLFADILECLNILTFNNLSKVIGIANAGRIWNDVKTARK